MKKIGVPNSTANKSNYQMKSKEKKNVFFSFRLVNCFNFVWVKAIDTIDMQQRGNTNRISKKNQQNEKNERIEHRQIDRSKRW